MNLKILSTSKFWIYNLSKNNYSDYIKSEVNYITFFEPKNINKNDIIIIFCKDRLNNGFGSILQVDGIPLKNNIDINIFKNDNLNRFYLKIKFKKIFIELIKISEIINYLKTDEVGYKSVISFRTKFFKNPNSIVYMGSHLYGKKITEKLIELSNNNIKNKNNDITDDKEDKNISSDDESKENKDISSDDENKENEKNESDDENKENNNEKNNEEEIENGFIPIIIIPCKNLKIESIINKDRIKYFIEHYKICNECEVTNNNNRELCSIINEAKFEFIEIKKEKHGYFNPPLECYLNLEKYEPIGIKQYPFIRIVYINNDHDVYNKCFLITWCE